MPKRLLSFLACGYIFVFYSEHVFWAHMRPTDTLLGYILTWLLYSMLALAFLSLIDHFKVDNIWALFLCAAVFGWLTEGVIVQTTYDGLPLSISFTALAWHAPLTIWIGWYAVRKAIRDGMRSTLQLSVAIGMFYGLWALTWWTEPGDIMASPLEFAAFAGITTLLLIIAYWTYDRTISAFRVKRRTKIIVVGFFAAYFLLVTVPTVPIAIIVLPLLLLMVYAALRRIPKTDNRPSLLTEPTPLPPLKNYLGVLVLPLTAIVIYTVAYAQGSHFQINWLVYLITMPLGFVLLGVSLVKVWQAKPKMEIDSGNLTT